VPKVGVANTNVDHLEVANDDRRPRAATQIPASTSASASSSSCLLAADGCKYGARLHRRRHSANGDLRRGAQCSAARRCGAL